MNSILSIFLNGFHSWKTTLIGVVATLVYLLHSWHFVDITDVQQKALVTIGLLVGGWIMKDANAAGTIEDE